MLNRGRPTCRILAATLAYLLFIDTMALSALQYVPAARLRVNARASSAAFAAATPAESWVSASDPTCGGRAPCFSSIQSAIDAAGPSTHVRILPGHYPEQLVIQDKNTHDDASEADRIVVGRDPGAPLGSVIVGPEGEGCWNGRSIVVERSAFVTVQGLVVRNAGRRGLLVRGRRRANRAIHVLQNVIYADRNPRCSGGIAVTHFNEATVIANNVVYGTRRTGIHIGDNGEGTHYVFSNTLANNGHTGIYVARGHEAWLVNNLVFSNGDGRSNRRFGIRQGRRFPRSEQLHVIGNLVCGNARGEFYKISPESDIFGNVTPTGAEGAGVSASPSCDDASRVFADLAGPDGIINTGDDAFSLAADSPALDGGEPLVARLPSVAPGLLRADLTRFDVRPDDGDANGFADYDIGAIEGGDGGPSPTPTSAPSPTPTEAPSPTPTGSPSPAPTETPSPTATQAPTPTPIATPGGSPPELQGIADQSIFEREILAFPIGATDPDLPQDVLTFSLAQKPAGASIDPRLGNFLWVPTADQKGPQSITVRVTDAAGAFDEKSFDVEVRGRGGPPVLDEIADPSTTVGAPVGVTARASDPDLPSDVLTYSIALGPTGMTIDPDSGLISWTPTTAQSGLHDVTVEVADSEGLRDFTSFFVTVATPDAAPIAADDAYVARFGETLTVAADGVLDNDADVDGDALSAMLVEPPQRGDVTFRADGSFDYRPTTFGTTVRESIDLTRLAAPQVVVSSSYTNSDPEDGVDGDLTTQWYADEGDRCDPGEPIESCAFFEQQFVRPVSVREIQYTRIPLNQAYLNRDFETGIFEIYDAEDTLLFTSADHGPDVDLLPSPAPNPPTTVIDVEALAGGPVENASRIVFRATGYRGTARHGFAELAVVGDGHIEVLQTEEEWGWTAESIAPGTRDNDARVLAAPAVADLDADGRPEVVFTAVELDRLYVVNGEDGSIEWFADDVEGQSSTPAIGDLDGDGFLEIVAPAPRGAGLVHVFEHDGTLKTTLDTALEPGLGTFPVYRRLSLTEVNLALADFDGDGRPEVVIPDSRNGGRIAVFHLVGDELQFFALTDFHGCGNNSYRGVCIPTVADVDLDGELEIVAGATIYGLPITERESGGSSTPFLTQMFTTEHRNLDFLAPGDRNWGWNGIGNFDDDAFAEIVMVGLAASPNRGQITVFEHDLTVKWGPIDLPDGGLGGPPTVADFDNDGEAEVGVASSSRYYVFDTDGSILWERAVVDASSNRTGSTVFDFQNDGSAEVVYSDERDLWVFRGLDGKVLYRTVMASSTTVEYPIVADVDGDGEAEIVSPTDRAIVDNSVTPPTPRVPGLYVFGSSDEPWVAARPIWNQHTYHVTNVTADGQIPAQEQPNWLLPGLNHFRQNDFLVGEIEGADSFTYKARGGGLDSNTATVVLDVRPSNAAPEIVSSPDRTATVGFEYVHAVRATDVDFDPIVFSLVDGPAGMVMDPSTGLLRWSPSSGDLGEHLVSVSATDDDGYSGRQGFVLAVGEPVRVPSVLGLDELAASSTLDAETLVVGNTTFRSDRSVAVGAILEQSPPPGSVVELGSEVDLVSSTGPAPEDVDDDGDGLSENEGDCDDTDPGIVPGGAEIDGNGVDENCDGLDTSEPVERLEVDPAEAILLEGEAASLTVWVIFADGSAQEITALAAWATTTPNAATVDPAGRVVAGDCGGAASCQAEVQATFGGRTGASTIDVVARDLGDRDPPRIELVSPVDGGDVVSPVDIVGTVDDPALVRFELSVAPADGGTFVAIGGGTTSILGDVLGSLDPTLMENDLYRLRLEAIDAGGNVSRAEIGVQVRGQQKTGHLRLTMLDLDVPLSGIPIRVTRSYDSRDSSRGDFGIGWKLGIESLKLACTPDLGVGWTAVRAGFQFGLGATGAHRCSLRWYDGTIEEFDLAVTPGTSAIVPFSFATTRFEARLGTHGTLESLDQRFVTVLGAQPGDVVLVDDSTLADFDPQRFRYTRGDGTVVVLHRVLGVESVTDLNGNQVTFEAGGISHSSGRTISLERDALGRVIRLTDPSGEDQTYEYDGSGNLAAHVDALGNRTTYRYDRNHRLLQVRDPLGRPTMRTEYDAEGRVVATTDAAGNRSSTVRDLSGRTETVTNRAGDATTFEYDEEGNVTARVDALGKRTEFTYDDRGNELSRKDPLGRVATQTFDERDNPLTRTDFEGNTTRFTYDERDRVLTMTDPEGNVRRNEYDARGNLLQTTDPEGEVTRHTYDARGLRATTTDPLGNVRSYVYDGFGNLVSETDPVGNSTGFAYDANGRLLREARTRTLPDGTKEEVATSYEYDAAGREVRVVDAMGNADVMTYDASGQQTSRTDADGTKIDFDYDVRNRLVAVHFPDGTEAGTSYDALGREIARTDRGGNTVQVLYDPLGREVGRIDSSGAATSVTYDAVGRDLVQEDTRGNQTSTTYGMNELTRTDATGNSVTYTLDSRDQPLGVSSSGGGSVALERDGLGRVRRASFSDGIVMTTEYDAAGRRTASIDETGRTTRYVHDGAGRLIQVIEPGGATTTYAYDELGNVLTTTDALGRVTRREYDAFGRVTKRILPLGQFETYSYDPSGNLLSHTDFNGETTTFAYDENDNLTRRTLPDGTVVPYEYSTVGDRVRAGGDIFTYDGRGLLITETKAGGEVIAHGYDAARNRTSVTTPDGVTTYAYDGKNRMVSATSADGTTTYAYDALNRPTTVSYPNGVTTEYAYDLSGAPTRLRTTGPSGLLAQYDYTIDGTGRRLRVEESGPETSGRIVDYAFDLRGQLVEEAIDEPGTTEDAILSWVYDAVGNRIRQTIVRAGVTTETAYIYDDNDRLVAEETTIDGVPQPAIARSWDANGNLLLRSDGVAVDTFVFDSDNRLASAELGRSAPPVSLSYTYDVDGIRTGKSVNGEDIGYLVDKSRRLASVLTETRVGESTTYTHGLDLISQRSTTDGVRYLQYDAQQSTRHLSDEVGRVTDRYTYDAYGSTLSSSGVSPNDYRYGGEQQDPDLGMYYLRARYYEHGRGAFASRDPFEGSRSRPGTMHPYAYGLNDPVNRADPSGEFLITAAGLTLFAGFVVFLLALYARGHSPVQAKEKVGDKGSKRLFAKVCHLGIAGIDMGVADANVLIYQDPRRTGGKPWVAQYDVDLSFRGVVADVGFSGAGPETEIDLVAKRRTDAFEGYGTFDNLGVTLVALAANWGTWQLPEGSTLDATGFSITGGLGLGMISTGTLWQKEWHEKKEVIGSEVRCPTWF